MSVFLWTYTEKQVLWSPPAQSRATVAQPGTARDCYTRWLEMELILK